MVGPTTKDLAAAAGVSLATVDRVLNVRPNVSERAKKKVHAAIEEIGFQRNLAAVNLLRNRPYRFRFVLPNQGDLYLEEILREISSANIALKNDMMAIDVVQLDMTEPIAIAGYLADLGKDELDGVAVMASESPPVRDAMLRLQERGIHVVHFLSGQENFEQADFVGVDNFAAGATAAQIIGRFVGNQSGSVMVVAESLLAKDSIERRLGFDKTIHDRFSNLHTLPTLETYGDKSRANTIIKNQLDYCDDLQAVYVLCAEARIPTEAIKAHFDLSKLVVVVHERTPFTVEALKSEEIDAIVAQNPGHVVRSALRILRARSELRQPIAAQEKIRIDILISENV